MLSVLPLPASELIQYLNIGFIAIIALCAIKGFFRGTMKSTYYFIASIIVFGLGWILMDPIMDPIINIILNFDLSMAELEVDGIALTTPLNLISEMITRDNPDLSFLFTEGSYSLELVQGAITIGLRLVYFILIIVLSFTLFFFMFGFVWLLVRKPLRRAFCKVKKYKKNGKPKYKKSFLSRIGGFGIGAVKGLMYTLLIGFILAGAASIATSMEEIISSETEELALVYTNDSFTLVELGSTENESENPLEKFDDVFELIKGYRETIPGKVFGSVKFGEDQATLDEYVFDSIFSIKTEKANVKLRNELRKVAQAFNNEAVQALMSDGFEINKIFELDKDDLRALVDTLSSLDTIKVVMPVGIEFITYSSQMEEMLGDNYEDIHQLLQENFDQLIDLDYCDEAKKLGYVFVDLVDLISKNEGDIENLDYFAFDQETLDQIFNNIGDLELLEIIAPVTITYLLNSDSIKKAIEDAGFTLEELGLTEDVDYVQELMNLPRIYEKVVDLGLKMVDGKVDLSDIDPEKVEGLVETIFDSVIISNAVPVLATTLTSKYLPDEYSGIFTKEELQDVDWKNEFSPLLTAATVLIKSGLLESEDPIDTLTSMEDAEFAELGEYLSQSTVLTNNLNEVLDVLMSSLSFENITFEGLDPEKGEIWNETEIVSLFKAVKVLLNSGIVGADDPMDSIKHLTGKEIDNLATYLSQSKFITKNLNGIVELALDNIDLGGITIEGLDEENNEYWNEVELTSLFGALKTIVDTGLITAEDPVASFKEISDADIDLLAHDLANSKFFTKNLNEVIKYAIKNMADDIALEALDSEQGEAWTELEIKSIFKGVKAIVDAELIGSDDIMTSFKEMKDETIEDLAVNLSSSVFLKKNINSLLDTFMKDIDFELERLDKEEWTSNEIYSLFKSVNVVATLSTSGNISVEDFLHLSNEDLDILLESKLIRESMKNILIEKSKEGEDLEILQGVYKNGKDENGVEVYQWNDEHKVVISNVSNGTLSFTPDANALKYIVYKNDIYFMSTEDSFNINLNAVEGYSYHKKDEFKVVAITSNGELRNIFNAISSIDIQNMDSFTIDLRNIVAEKETILSSYIFTETLIHEIRLQDKDNAGGSLIIPTELKEGGTGQWRGNDGELISLIDALDIALEISISEEPVPTDNIDVEKVTFKKIIDNQDIMFKSGILTATIVYEIQDLGNSGILTIPLEYQSDDISLWKNNGSEKGELALFFDGLEYVVELPEKGFEVNTETIHIKDLIIYEDEIFKSSVLTATLVERIVDLDGTLAIPEEYKLTNHSWDTDYGKWKNVYTNGVVTFRGELSYALEAIDLILGITSSPDEISINSLTEKLDTIHIEDIINNKDDILLSYIIMATIADKVIALSSNGLDIPKGYENSYEPWANKYEGHTVLVEGEVSRLLDAVYISLGLNENTQTSIDTINIDNMELANITKDENRDQLLYSAVYTETLKQKIISFASDGSGSINLPKNYNVSTSNNYVVWENEYNNGNVEKYGELNYILKSLDLLMGNASITDLSGLDYHALFVGEKQDEILKSKVISETVICKIVETNQDSLSIPANKGLDNYDDRSAWLNAYDANGEVVKRNELANTLNALDKMLLDNQKNDLLNVDLYETLDNVLGLFKSTEDKKVLLKSYIVAETLKDNIYNIKAIKDNDKDYIKSSFERYYGVGCDTSNSSYWYEMDSNGNVVAKELWNVLTGAAILLNGESLTDENQEFTLDKLVSNKTMIPIYNSSFEVIDSQIDVMLQSIILEEVFAKLAEDMFNTKLSAIVDAPEGGFNWHRKDTVGTTKEYDLKTFLESFYIIQQYIDVTNIASSYTGLLQLNSAQISDLGAGMIISRTFRSSIANMFNTIFGIQYQIKAATNPAMKPWNEVKFDQNDYVETLSRTQAHANFVQTYTNICVELNK